MWKEIKKKDEDIQRIYTLRKKTQKRERKRFQGDIEHDRSTLRKHIYGDWGKIL